MNNTLPLTGGECHQARSFLSLAPLIDFWKTGLIPRYPRMAPIFDEIMVQLPEALRGNLSDDSDLEEYSDALHALMTAVVPPASFDRELTAMFPPCSFDAFYATPKFEQLFLDRRHTLKPVLLETFDSDDLDRVFLNAYYLVLERVYGFTGPFSSHLNTRGMMDERTGLERYYEEIPDYRFVELTPVGKPRPLSEPERDDILDNLSDLSLLSRLIDLSRFEFKGFVIIRVQDITEKAILSALERNLVDDHSIFSSPGIQQIESRLQSLFRRPDLGVSISSLEGDHVMVTQNDHHSKINCLFSNSHHFRLKDLEGSVWMTAAQRDGVYRVPDLSKKKDRIAAESVAVSAGIRSMLLSPLQYQANESACWSCFLPIPMISARLKPFLWNN